MEVKLKASFKIHFNSDLREMIQVAAVRVTVTVTQIPNRVPHTPSSQSQIASQPRLYYFHTFSQNLPFFPCLFTLSNSTYASTLPPTLSMVLIDGNSEIGAHVRSNLCYLICLRHLIRSRAVTNRISISEKTYFALYVRNMF